MSVIDFFFPLPPNPAPNRPDEKETKKLIQGFALMKYYDRTANLAQNEKKKSMTTTTLLHATRR